MFTIHPGIINWLLDGDPWVRYNTRIHLLGQQEDDPSVHADHKLVLDSDIFQGIVNELTEWPGKVVTTHKNNENAYHKLVFLADIGIKHDDPGMPEIIAKVFENQSEDGPFNVLMNIPTHFGGTGLDSGAWALCDVPLTVYALARFGYRNDPRVMKAAEYLHGLVRDNGYPCAVSKELGTFKGPGRKADPCPYATLLMLKMMLAIPSMANSPEVKISAESLLMRWQNSLTEKPYAFYMGTDFRKLKMPMIWYDILHVVNVLRKVPGIENDKRFIEMVEIIRAKADPQGRFTPESVYKYWADFDIGQKKVPSRWLTLEVYRSMKGLK